MERLLQRAREVAAKALAGDVRGNGAPMYEHASAVARIVADEIGLPETCIAAVYLHEAT
ncbi:MAG: HD domain-containing protein, partial [Bacteroidales bacterium]|nr:HD domain-containing protein [Bacteroidales bacterium]